VFDTVTHTYSVAGVTDEATAAAVTAVLEAMPGVHRAHTSPRSGYAVVDADPAVVDPHRLAAALTGAGFPAQLRCT